MAASIDLSKSAGAGGLLASAPLSAIELTFPLGYNLRWVPSLKKDGDCHPRI